MLVIEDKRSAHLKYINLPNSKILLTIKRCEKESSANLLKMCEPQSKDLTCLKYLWDVRRHQERSRTSPEKNLCSKVIYWRYTHGKKQANEQMGEGTLFKSPLSSEHRVSRNLWSTRAPSNHGWARLRPNHWGTQQYHWSLNQWLINIPPDWSRHASAGRKGKFHRTCVMSKHHSVRKQSDCNIYRSIFLLIIMGKFPAHVIIVRLP